MYIPASLALFFACSISAATLYPRNNPPSPALPAPTPTPAGTAAPEKTTQKESKEWSYDGQEGPLHWASDFAECRVNTQSPVDLLSKVVTADTKQSPELISSIKYNWPELKQVKATHKGYTINLEETEKSVVWFAFAGTNYSMVNVHYHTPGEHRENNKFVELEVHVVFQGQTDEKKLLAVGVRFTVVKGGSHDFISSIINGLPNQAKEVTEVKKVALDKLAASLNNFGNIYTYLGSLTVPPCTQRIQWLVVKQILEINVDDYKKLRDLIGFSSRPTTLGINEPDNIPI